MKILKPNYLIIIILFISACSSVPKNVANSCSIFSERYLWYKHAKKTENWAGCTIHTKLSSENPHGVVHG